MTPELPLDGELRELNRLCEPGSSVVEVGAHHGMMTLLMSQWVGESGKVHAIEAGAENAMALDANCFRNEVSNVSTAFVAVGERSGTVRFGGESLAAQSGVVREVPMVTLDRFCHDRGVDRIDVLKIDFEGFEKGVLDGATKVLSQRPKLALELHVDSLRDAGSSAQAVWDKIDTSGMLNGRRVTMLSRPNWDDVRDVNQFADLPKSGVVNVFVA